MHIEQVHKEYYYKEFANDWKVKHVLPEDEHKLSRLLRSNYVDDVLN